MKLFLGIDGGQSSTTALIGDESGRVLGYGRGGPCNHVKTGDGRAKFVNAISGCVRTACEQAGIGFEDVVFAAAAAGFSGGPADKEQLLQEMLRGESWLITHDGLIALTGATAGDPGIITIAGTGQFSFGRNAAGKTARAGGWGYVFGDEGGGFDLTRQAMRAALRQEEGWGPATILHGRLLAESGAKDANELVHWFYTPEWPRARIASMARIVDEAAREGDTVAIEVLMQAAQALAGYTAAVRGQLFREGEAAYIAPIGGVWQSVMLRERFTALVELSEGNRVGDAKLGPAAGALIEAYRLAGIVADTRAWPEFSK